MNPVDWFNITVFLFCVVMMYFSMREYIKTLKCGFLFQCGGFWMGVHYSKYNRRFCVNFLPCCTFWVTLAGGKTPR